MVQKQKGVADPMIEATLSKRRSSHEQRQAAHNGNP
jgi:hypothetical protein